MNLSSKLSIRRIVRIASALVVVIAGLVAYQSWRSGRQTSVVVEWSTASEIDTAGFNLYRSEVPQGSFEKVNDSLIPASDDPLLGGDYQYEDNDVDVGKTYYYQLEDVELDGSTTIHGPIQIEARDKGTIELSVAVVFILLGLSGLIWAYRFA